MAQQTPPGEQLSPQRYTERRQPTFTGGSVDPDTGNIIPATRGITSSQSAGDALKKPSVAADQLPSLEPQERPRAPTTTATLGGLTAPAMPQTRLNTISPTPQAGGGSGAGLSAAIAAAALAPQLARGGSIFSNLTPTPATSPSSVSGLSYSSPAPASSFDETGFQFAYGAPSQFSNLPSAPAIDPSYYAPPAPPTYPASAYQHDIATNIGIAPSGDINPQQLVHDVQNFGKNDFFTPVVDFFSNIFCHVAGTPIRMEDGSFRPIEALKIGDRVALGGAVVGRGEVLASDLYLYRGTVVNGRHAVFESGRWVRVADTDAPRLVDPKPRLVYPIVTEHHLLVCERYICADYAETDDADMSASARLNKLNWNAKRNAELDHALELLGLPRAA